MEGKVREREDPKTLRTGQPSPEVVEAIVKASDYMKSKDRLRRYRRGAIWTLAVLLCLIAGAGATSLVMMGRAVDQAAIAESRALANLSQTVIQRRTGTLQRSIGLAIDAIMTAAARGTELSKVTKRSV